jgi:hypothetical protein
MNQIIKIKKGIDNLLQESYLNKESNSSKLILEEIANNKNLQILYYTVNNLENPPALQESEIEDFINENIRFSNSIDKSDLKGLSSKLNNLELTDLEKSISIVLFEERNALNFVEYNESKKMIYEHIKSKNVKNNLDLSQFSEEELSLAKNFIDNPETVFKQISEECLSVLDNKLNEASDDETKMLIYKTKEKIYETQLKNQYEVDNLINLISLKNSLINE